MLIKIFSPQEITNIYILKITELELVGHTFPRCSLWVLWGHALFSMWPSGNVPRGFPKGYKLCNIKRMLGECFLKLQFCHLLGTPWKQSLDIPPRLQGFRLHFIHLCSLFWPFSPLGLLLCLPHRPTCWGKRSLWHVSLVSRLLVSNFLLVDDLLSSWLNWTFTGHCKRLFTENSLTKLSCGELKWDIPRIFHLLLLHDTRHALIFHAHFIQSHSWPINLNMHVFRLWEEARVPGEKTHAPSRDWNQIPSGCEVTALTTG